MSKTHFSHINTWIFDLDNTLYPRHCDLFAQIDIKMTEYIMVLMGLPFDEARVIQKDLYKAHGTTLNGLVINHQIDPHDYLDKVHDIDYSEISANPELGEIINALPGRKFIFTNGDRPHAERTLKQLNIKEDYFEDIFGIVDANFEPKPARAPYDDFIKKYDIDPKSASMFEDMPRNLQVPDEIGMCTVLIEPNQAAVKKLEPWELIGHDAPYIHHRTDDINDFLQKIL
jgi:putative hydrolase of the HAD superfamily